MPFARNKTPAGISKRPARQLASHTRWLQSPGGQFASGANRLIGKARTVNHGHWHQPANVAMSMPGAKLHHIIRPHDPCELRVWTGFS
jgi:hypothetical protein